MRERMKLLVPFTMPWTADTDRASGRRWKVPRNGDPGQNAGLVEEWHVRPVEPR